MDLISRILDQKRPTKTTSSRSAKKTIVQAVVEQTAQSLPIVKTVQAIQSLLEVSSNVSHLVAKASDAAEKTQRFIPEMQVMAQSFCDNAMVLGYFSSTATIVGIGANMVQTYQGVQALQLIAARLEGINTQLAAQTALVAQRDFPQYVYDMVGERLNQTLDDGGVCEHWFFLYHPDNDWYPKFYHLLEAKPLGRRFCGYTNQLDSVFLFMLAARRQVESDNERLREKGREGRRVKLHLLMPAYQPVLIAEALKIPEQIGEFVMEGRINSNKPFFWLNLPEDQRRYATDIGHWAPPSVGWFEWAMLKVGVGEQGPVLGEPRLLGTRQRREGEENYSECERSDEDASQDADADEADEVETASVEGVPSAPPDPEVVAEVEAENNRHNATPLQHRRKGHRKKSRHTDSKEKSKKDKDKDKSRSSSSKSSKKRESRRDKTSTKEPDKDVDKESEAEQKMVPDEGVAPINPNPWID